MGWQDIRGHYEEPMDDDPRGHWHLDAEDRRVGDVVFNRALMPAALAELRDWYGVRVVSVKGPCYGGERCS